MQYIKSGSRATSEAAVFINDGWQLFASDSGVIEKPEEISEKITNQNLTLLPAIVPGTVAQSLQQAGQWDISKNEDFDAKDWWYQTTFDYDLKSKQGKKILRFDGLATLAEVWLNGTSILVSNNMFLQYEVDVTDVLQESNTLIICFRSLHAALSERRPRPRWKTKLVNQQQLRWIRSTLLGRIPGWTPPVAPVGPWRDIVLESSDPLSVNNVSLQTSVDGEDGLIDFSCILAGKAANEPVTAVLKCGDDRVKLAVDKNSESCKVSGQLSVNNPKFWWPHTHGTPALYDCEVEVTAGDNHLKIDCGKVGFRYINVDQNDGAFKVSVNGESVFCRGACWTINDIVSINGTQQELEHSLLLAREAGINMIRIGGTMVYESEEFYSLCDELGIMVWQDFMFANMDYPIDDEQFAALVTEEITEQLNRLQSHPCVTVYCGNSEIEQQAAMLGMPEELWRSSLFAKLIPDLCEKIHPNIPYVPSTPTGGTLPFHVGTGITHYYGVGAYMRPFTDVRRSNVQFTPECLGFSNVPENKTVNGMFDGQLPVCHHPIWKSRVPRDTGAGWDFEDIRDHYIKVLFDKDPVQLRCFDMDQYLALSRITTGEVMEQVFSEWRSNYSECGGGLVWFYKDLWPGAGWGIVDSLGNPKACYRYMQRVWQPQTVVLTDEGLDGLHAHIINEKDTALDCVLELQLLRDGQVVVAKAERAVKVEARSKTTIESDDLLNGFYDVTYSYKFGPLNHNVVAASLIGPDGKPIAESFYFTEPRKSDYQKNINVSVNAVKNDDDNYVVTLQSDTLLQAVHFDVKGYYPSAEYFHLLPGREKTVVLRKVSETVKRFKGYIESISLPESVTINVNDK